MILAPIFVKIKFDTFFAVADQHKYEGENMRFKYLTAAVVVALIAISACVQAAAIQVELEKKGTYICWFDYISKDGISQSNQPVRVQGNKTELELPDMDATASASLCVMNRKDGNVAVLPVKVSDKKPISISKDDFGYVGTVTLHIQTEDGSAVESAAVRVTDGEGNESIHALIPSDRGALVLHNVASGQINVKVETDGLKKTLDSDIELPLDRDDLAFETDVRVSGDVNTIGNASVSSSDRQETKSSKSHKNEQSPISSILNSLVGLFILVIIAVVIIVVLRARGVTAQKALQQMGVNVPEEEQGNAAPSGIQGNIPTVDSNKCPFCGQEKDAAGNCACTLSSAPSSYSAPSGLPAEPKFVGRQGIYVSNIFPIKNGAIIGRESTCDIPLPNDTTVSRRHAVLTQAGDDWKLKDENSSNGTFVNGAKISEQILKTGDEVRIGETVFTFEI